MALLLTHEDVCAAVSMADAIEAMERGFAEQGDGQVVQPQRLNLKAGKGWLRLGPAVMERSGYMGFKAMNLAPGKGMRYQIHLYRVEDGELLAVMDAQHLTTLRTGGTSAVATRRLAGKQPGPVAVLGAGAEARAQAEAMHVLGLATSMHIYSRTPENRRRFADDLATGLGIAVTTMDSAREAVDGCSVVVAAVKSSETVLSGEWLAPGTHVNSVGTARPDQREIDAATFQRASVIVVDSREGVFGEAGDAVAAKDVFSPEQAHELADLVAGRAPARTDAQQITLFKSVGTALQDVALAAAIYERAAERGLGRDVGAFPMLKPA
ncbi:MAG: ornithine cyclodeaminase family protein [Chloroflexi bacterium]|nr:ornithine cyclodeaminase family protein [Chloroflexota bacterium]